MRSAPLCLALISLVLATEDGTFLEADAKYGSHGNVVLSDAAISDGENFNAAFDNHAKASPSFVVSPYEPQNRPLDYKANYPEVLASGMQSCKAAASAAMSRGFQLIKQATLKAVELMKDLELESVDEEEFQAVMPPDSDPDWAPSQFYVEEQVELESLRPSFGRRNAVEL